MIPYYGSSQFLLEANKVISGHNNKQLKNVSSDQCKAACIAETTFMCKSFDYNVASKWCDLSTSDKHNVGLSAASGYEHWYRYPE